MIRKGVSMTYRRMVCLVLAMVFAASFMPLSWQVSRAEEIVTEEMPSIPADDDVEIVPEDADPAEDIAANVGGVADVDEIVPVADDVVFGDEDEIAVEAPEEQSVSFEAADYVAEIGAPEDIAEPEAASAEDAAVVTDDTAPADEKLMETASIGEAPTYGGVFDVYDTYFNFYPYDMAMQNQRYDLYMEYSSDGVNWARTGYMRANLIKLFPQQGYKIDGLAPKTLYQTRIFYGKYLSTGQFVTGPVLNTQAILTGSNTAPNIKKITLKSKKIKRHRVRHPGYYNYAGGMLFWHRAYTETYYTCRVKVIVKLRQKPGTNGMWINFAGQRKYVPGNRKKYSATFTPYPNYFAKKPKNRYKYTVSVRSGQHAEWGGYSPEAVRTKKLR